MDGVTGLRLGVFQPVRHAGERLTATPPRLVSWEPVAVVVAAIFPAGAPPSIFEKKNPRLVCVIA